MPKIDIVNAKNIIESNPEKAFFKLKNTGGPKGDTGAQGPQGPKGDQGEPGAPGASASVTVGSTTTLSPGADATVTNSGDTRNAILNFGIPTGAQGPQGIQGPKGDTGPMGQTGAKGDTGAAATVQVGNTNTGAPGTNAQVTNAGNEHFAVFNFTIPRGDKGETGATGAQGAKGDKGDKGDAGTAATITVGSTTTTNPGTNATVTNSGTTSAAVLNFGIPRGATGSVKSDVVAELPETGEEDTFYLVNREATEQTATGKAISFTNNDNAGDITDFKLDGETSQNGTPTPSAPVAVNTTTGENVVKICGKNLFKGGTPDYTGQSACSGYGNGNYTLVDNGYNFPDRYNAIAFEYDDLEVGESYTVSFDCVGSSTFWAAVGVNKQSGASGGTLKDYAAKAESQRISFTFTASETNRIGFHSGYTASTTLTITNIQLELGSTATAYEPYQGQSYEVNLGKNLLNSGGVVQITGQIQSDKTLNTISGSTVYMLCQPNTTYVFSKANTNRTRLGTAANLLDSSHNLTNYVAGTSTTPGGRYYGVITSGPQDKYIYLTYSEHSGTTVETVQGQLEIGNEPSAYDSSAPIELCKIGDYQDYIYKSGDKWYVHKEIGKAELGNGTNWRRLNTGPTGEYRFSVKVSNTDIPTSSSSSTLVDMYSNYWLARTRLQTYQQTQGIATTTSTDIGVESFIAFVDSIKTSDVDGWKAWLTANMPVVYYPSTTPTDTEITNEALIEQLDNVASAPLYTGVNNITTITPNEQGTLEIKYVTYDKYNQNKVYIWNDTLQQWQIIVP